MYTDEELSKLVRESNERALAGRLDRLRYLLSREDQKPFLADALAKEYYEEARLCWYAGAFVATIIMSQLTLEETLRSHYCRAGLQRLDNGKELDRAGFAELIEQATADGLLSSEEGKEFHKLREDYRNPYVHPRRAPPNAQEPSCLSQLTKITAPELLETSVEDEARESIAIAVLLFPKISRRMWGMEEKP